MKLRPTTNQSIDQGSNNTQVAGNLTINKYYSPSTTPNSNKIAMVAQAIANSDFDEVSNRHGDGQRPNFEAFDPSEKIDYNELRRSAPQIRDHVANYSEINALVVAISEERGGSGKRKFLRNIKSIYRSVSAKIPSNTEGRGDLIFSEVTDKIRELACQGEIDHDDSYYAAEAVAVYGFLECHLLERPPT